MNMKFIKVLRALNHRGILPPAVRAAYRLCADRKVLEYSVEDAWDQIYRLTPRPAGNTYWERTNNGAPVYDLSVIIPFYNTEDYAVQCIESVLSQVTDFRMEVILVDDGSPDSSGMIIDTYADRENVVVIHQKNQGLSAARNTGIVQARGEYLMFLDSDDYLADGAVQKLMTAVRQHDADMAEGAHITVTTDGKIKQTYSKTPGVYTHGANMFGYAWAKVIRRTLFQNICFPVGCWYEDGIIANLIFPAAQTTVTIADPVYYYRANPKGITASTHGNVKSIHTIYVVEDVLSTFHKLGLEYSFVQHRLLIMELSKWLMMRVYWMDEAKIQALFIAACDVAERYHLLPTENVDDYFYNEIIHALRNRQYNRWKWASVLI